MLCNFRGIFLLWLCFLLPIFSNSLEFQNQQIHLKPTALYATVSELELIRNSLEFIKDEKCRRDLNATLWGLMNNAQWAVSMYDASVRNPVGIESNMVYQFGHFDQCLRSHLNTESETTDSPQPIKAQYCLSDVTMNGLTLDSKFSVKELDATEALTTYWGECVPAVCGSDDVAIYLQHILQRNVTVNTNMCQLQGENEQPMTTGMVIYACIISFFLFLTILSTGYQIFWPNTDPVADKSSKLKQPNKPLKIALLSFSLLENTKKIFQASRDQQGLNPINGIKAIAMLFILNGHAAIFAFAVQIYNPEFFKVSLSSPILGYLTNSLLFVDVFLLLSGYLLFRNLYVELEKRKGKINPLILYIARYIRLTPSYLVVICFYMTWFKRLDSGPLWQHRIEREQQNCQDNWWLNILYINNYFNTENLCMFQSWYLSADTQLFFLASIVVSLMYRFKKIGLYLLIALATGSSLIPFIITFIGELPPALLFDEKSAEYIPASEYFRDVYIKTHVRASSYFIGVLAGYIAHHMQSKSIKIPKPRLRTLWIFSSILGIGALFTLFRFYTYPYSILESTLYAGFHRLAWNIAVAFFLLAVTTGHCVWLQRFLSLRLFVPFARLTYCAFLANGLVELFHSSNIRLPQHLHNLQMGNVLLGHTSETFLFAFALCLIFESPIHALERTLKRALLNGAGKTTPSQSSGEISPSTSEEQVA